MNLAYDLHLHSCLSPCGDRDMTPNNIVNMAIIMEQDIIALTDHNSCKNCRATIEAGNRHGITVVPGMELCTSEEIHVVCLFPECYNAEQFDQYIYSKMFPIKNKPLKFGEQLIISADDKVIGQEEILLINATSISIEEIIPLCAEYGGACFPAHINRSSYSILSALGTFPSHLPFKYAELSYDCDITKFCLENDFTNNLKILQSSDAHYLENMADKNHTINLYENSPKALVDKIGHI